MKDNPRKVAYTENRWARNLFSKGLRRETKNKVNNKEELNW